MEEISMAELVKQELKAEIKPIPHVGLSAFMALALKSVEGVQEEQAGKGTAVRFSAEYCNQVIAVLKQVKEFAQYSDTEMKLCLKAFFGAIILNAVAHELKVIKE